MAEYFVGITDKGKRRDYNEDTFIACEFSKKEFVVACVIDGVGGYSGGEIAAAITRSVLLERLKNLPEDIIKALQEALIAANKKIAAEKRKDNSNEQMACVLTCAVADIKHNKLYYAHVGDTRLYLLRDQSLVKLSKDHSVVGFLEESGRLSEEDAMSHPRRNEITKALGFEADIETINDFIETGESPFLPGDMILVCSDGLSDMISSAGITAILLQKNNLTKKANELVTAANEAGGNDNITAVLVQNTNVPTLKVALKPVEKKRGKPGNAPLLKESPHEKQARPYRRSRSFIVLLLLLSLGLVSMMLFNKTNPVKPQTLVETTATVKPVNENVALFMQAINDSIKKYSFKPLAGVVNLSVPVFISKDSFYLQGNGIIISSDSTYKGPAFIISNSARYIVLDSIIFKNFDVAILFQKSNVVFKNVRFVNCRIPVQYEPVMPDTMLSGKFRDSIFIPVSTLKKL